MRRAIAIIRRRFRIRDSSRRTARRWTSIHDRGNRTPDGVGFRPARLGRRLGVERVASLIGLHSRMPIRPRRHRHATIPARFGRLFSRDGRERRTGPVTDGTVIIIGGAEDKVRDRVILNRFVTLAGGRDATIAVISTASSMGAEAGERYRQVFTELGVAHVRPLHAVTRPQANDETAAIAVRDATGVFLTGGNQLRLSSTIGGTRLADAMLERFRHGAVVAGTSAGASAMSSHMIAFGASGATPKHRMAQIAAGLGMLPGVIVDQHFQQRNRLGRLLSLIAQNPSLLGLGVDEDTAGVVGPDHVLEVIGRGSITVVDGSASETDAWEVHGHKPLMISGVVLHSLPAGYRFDLRRRHRLATPTLRALQGGGEAAST
jgi:cyanophycinase